MKQWTVSASAIRNDYYATVTPKSFIADVAAVKVNVTFEYQPKPPVRGDVLGAYWAAWTGLQFNLAKDYSDIGLTHLFLAFANYQGGKIDTSVSGNYLNIPPANY